MSEKTQRQAVIKALKPLHGISIENLVGVGTPDVNHSLGWIELKVIKDWPKKSETPIRIDHYSPAQKVWAKKRDKVGGMVHVLLLVESTREWILLDGVDATDLIGYVNRDQLCDAALAIWVGSRALRDNLAPCLLQQAASQAEND